MHQAWDNINDDLKYSLIAAGAFALAGILLLIFYTQFSPQQGGLLPLVLHPEIVHDKSTVLASLSANSRVVQISDEAKLKILKGIEVAGGTQNGSQNVVQISEQEKLRVLQSLQVK